MSDGQTSVPVTTPPGENLVFSEDIVAKRLIGLCFKNLILTILTLGLYNFWARTHVRRRVWAGTIINDEPLEYRGRGMELFIGFLLVTFCILLPGSLILGLGSLFLGQGVMSGIGTLFSLTFMYLSFVALYRARAYLCSRTSWRGVRLHQGPDWGWFFGWSVIGHYLMVFITAGWWAPRMRMKMAYDLWQRTSWGDEKFVFNEGEKSHLAKGLYWPFALLVFGAFAIFIVAIGMAGALSISLVQYLGPQPDPKLMAAAGILAFIIVAIPALIVASFIGLPYQAAIYRQIAGKLRIDNLRFKLDVKALPLYWLQVVNIFIIVFSLGLLMPLAQARSWRFLVRRLSTEGSINLAGIEQAANRGPAAGEGLADAMHISILSGGL